MQTSCSKATQGIDRAIQCDKDDVEFEILVKEDHDASCSLVEQRALAVAQTGSVLRQQWAHMEPPMLLFLGYVIGSQWRG